MRYAQWIGAAVGAALLAGSAGGALAATRVCAPRLDGVWHSAATERAARTGALASWVAQAGRLGPAFASWRLANNKSITCSAPAGGQVRCQARGSPCIMSQVPLRPGAPLPFRPPAPRGSEIEI
jgi:hypothetical protein